MASKVKGVSGNGEFQKRLRKMEELAENALLQRSRIARAMFDPRRDINDDCGYPSTESITSDLYRELYDREPVATRVVEVLPRESWRVQPRVFETEDIEETTAFEAAWRELDNFLRGQSYYQDAKGSPIWEHLIRADILSGIGSYGVLLLGIDDGKDLAEPVEGRKGARLLFLRSFDETLASISSFDSDPQSTRFGQPTIYSLSFADPNTAVESGLGAPTATRRVHWSRVIHVADNLGSSEVFGVPRMRPVFNRLYDLRKLYGGSAEMYWRGAFPGLFLGTIPELGPDVQIDTSTARTQLEQYMNSLQRYIALSGVTAKSLAPQVVDPTPQINTQIEAICIRLGIPKRVFTGSERGELASSQDAKAWHDRLSARQEGYITPRIIVPFVDRLVSLGILPAPKGYSVAWPSMDSLTEAEQAAIAVQRVDAMAKYVQGDGEAIMTPIDFYVRVLGLDQDEAESIVEAVGAGEIHGPEETV